METASECIRRPFCCGYNFPARGHPIGGGMHMKLFLIGAGVILEAVNVLVLYCALCVASEADRQMEEYDREQFFRKSEDSSNSF